MNSKDKSWFEQMLGLAENCKPKMIWSVILSVISISSGLIPFYCMYRVIRDFAADTADSAAIMKWCMIALAAFAVKVVCFSFSTALSHVAAYEVLESIRSRIADRFLRAPLGTVQEHSIGDIKNIIVDKTENMEPPLAHMVPEGAGHIVLPIVSFIALIVIDWRIALAALVTFPAAFLCMGLTFKI